MKASGVLDLIKELKNSSCEVQALGENILDYIYVYLKKDYFDPEMNDILSGMANDKYGYSGSLSSLDDFMRNVYVFLDKEDGSVISYFREMVKDNKKEFIDLFIEKSEPYFELIKNKYYNLSDYNIASFSFNLYVMLAAYHFCKDDFERYKCILDDSDFLIEFKRCPSSSNFLTKRKGVIDLFISSSVYDKNDVIRNEFISVLRDISNYYSRNDNYFASIGVALNSIAKIQKEHEEVCEEFPNALMLDINSLSSTIIGVIKYDRRTKDKYYKYFLLGHRYNFLNSSLSEYIASDDLNVEIIRRVRDMDFTMFNEHSVDENGNLDFDKNDFLIKCLERVLDSDCFEEVNRKLVALKYASELYRDGEKEKALSICDKLCTSDYKCVHKGVVVEYNVDSKSINQVDKPKRIVDRVVAIYKKLYPDISYKISDILSDAYKDEATKNLSTFHEVFEKKVEQSYEDMCEIKRKEAEEKARLELEKNKVSVVEEVVEEPVVEKKEEVPQKRISIFKGWK